MAYNHINEFDYELPETLIAQYPLPERTASRLMKVSIQEQSCSHGWFPDVLEWLNPGDLLVLNDTKVFPARLYGAKETGGQIECLIERVVGLRQALTHIKASKAPKVGSKLKFDAMHAEVISREGELFLLEFDCEELFSYLEKSGHIPLPPYISREDETLDESRYQTVYAKHRGAVAAPTAGLHFSKELLSAIEKKGIKIETVTLHVGAGTFQPVRVESISSHKMHRETFSISQACSESVNQTHAEGGRVLAVGTTTLRALESASRSGKTCPYAGETDLFIRPGFQFNAVDALVTNFHLPKSTLLMLVTAFGGYDNVMQAYREAVVEHYRFFSYGDAMLIG